MNSPFFIIALPRSRTAWLANLLTYGGAFCFHDGLRGCASITDFARKLAGTGARHVGNADSSLPMVFDDLRMIFPHARYVFVRRDYDEALASFEILLRDRAFETLPQGLERDVEMEFERLAAALHRMAREIPERQILEVDYADLDNVETCRRIWDWCVQNQLPFSPLRWELLHELNVQTMPRKSLAHMDWPAARELFGQCDGDREEAEV